MGSPRKLDPVKESPLSYRRGPNPVQRPQTPPFFDRLTNCASIRGLSFIPKDLNSFDGKGGGRPSPEPIRVVGDRYTSLPLVSDRDRDQTEDVKLLEGQFYLAEESRGPVPIPLLTLFLSLVSGPTSYFRASLKMLRFDDNQRPRSTFAILTS